MCTRQPISDVISALASMGAASTHATPYLGQRCSLPRRIGTCVCSLLRRVFVLLTNKKLRMPGADCASGNLRVPLSPFSIFQQKAPPLQTPPKRAKIPNMRSSFACSVSSPNYMRKENSRLPKRYLTTQSVQLGLINLPRPNIANMNCGAFANEYAQSWAADKAYRA